MGATRCRAGTYPIAWDTRRRRAVALLVLGLVVLSLAVVVPAHPARAVSNDARHLLNLINQDRAAVGSQPLTFRDDLVQIAADHSAWMASTGIFQHRSDLSEGVTGPWTRIGENIAYGWSVPTIHRMFMESKGHCENNLYAGFNRVGIEFATGGNGAQYVTVVFVQESGGSLPKPTVCPYDYSTTTTTAPPVTTTTVPPVTTTTAPPATTTTVPPVTTTTVPPVTTTTVPPVTTTTVPPVTTTTAPPVTTTTAPPVTTTTAPPVTTTTAPPVTTTTVPATTTTTGGAEVALSVPSTTTTAAVRGSSDGTATDRNATSAEPVASAAEQAADGGQSTVHVIPPVAGSAALLAAAAAAWLIVAERAAVRKDANIPKMSRTGPPPPRKP